MSADALWHALARGDTRAIADQLYPPVCVGSKVVVRTVPNPLDHCGDCGAPDRFGDFRVVTIRGHQFAVCDECSKHY